MNMIFMLFKVVLQLPEKLIVIMVALRRRTTNSRPISAVLLKQRKRKPYLVEQHFQSVVIEGGEEAAQLACFVLQVGSVFNNINISFYVKTYKFSSPTNSSILVSS